VWLALSSRGVSHDEAQSLLAAYAAGTLAEADAEGVRAHLASGCIQCLTSVFARPVGLPRDLPIVHAAPAEPPPRRSPWPGVLVGAALVAGLAGGALVLGRGDAGREPPDVVPAPIPGRAAETPVTAPPVAARVPERTARLDGWDDETPIIRMREDDETTTCTSLPAETTTSTLPADAAAEPVQEPPSEMVVATAPEGVATSTPSTAEPVPPSASPPPTAEPQAAIPTIPPGEIERAQLRRLLEAERAELDERTRELEDANDRARAAEAETVEQAAALAALEKELAAARRRADDLDRKQLSAPVPRRRAESAAGDAMLASPDARLLPLRAVGAFHDVRGHVVWRPGTEGVVVYGFGLPNLPNGRTYNVRVDVGSGEAITIPRLRPDDRGRLIVPVRLPSGAHAVSSVRIARDLDGDAVLAGSAPASTLR